MHGSRSAAEQSAIRGQAPYRRGAAGEADAAVGEGEAAVWVSTDWLVASRRGMACRAVSSVSAVAAGGAESACKEAEKASSGLERQRLSSATGRGPKRCLVLGLRVRPDGERQSTEVAVGRGRVHARVLGAEGRSRHHERGRDRHALRAIRDAWCARSHSQRQRKTMQAGYTDACWSGALPGYVAR